MNRSSFVSWLLIVETRSTPNLQPLTPKVLLVPAGRKSKEPAGCDDFHPEGTSGFPWELEVGSWELTFSFNRSTGTLASSAPPRADRQPHRAPACRVSCDR